jgi:hypothetical protein
MKDILKFPANKISLEELQTYFRIEEYQALVELVRELMEKNRIQPIKSSRLNGKRPGLYLAYRILREKADRVSWKEELRYMVPELVPDYYLRNQESYGKDREYIRKLNEYFLTRKDRLDLPVSVNERSFEIFGREKFLLKEGGKRILRNLGLAIEALNCYETSQPLAYYSYDKREGQTMLIVENKDTFYSMRKHLLDDKRTVFGVQIDTLIYGGGKAIYRSVNDFELCLEPYMRSPQNRILYFGDLDYEGILIYEQVATRMQPVFRVEPFTVAYEGMLKKSKQSELPISSERQNKSCGHEFFSYFMRNVVMQMKGILEDGRYIPQEILQMHDW